MKKPITFLLFALTIHFTFGQDCNQSFQNAYLHGNEIRAVIPSGNFTEGVDLETNNMAKGIYFIKLTIDNQIFTKKVVKQ